MTITAKKVTRWETSDGAMHTSEEMARAHILNAEICELFSNVSYPASADPQNIVNIITSNAKAIREFLDASAAMERKVMES